MTESVQKKIEALEKKVKELKENDFHYEKGEVVMLKDNLLLVEIKKPIKKLGRKYYLVGYNHLHDEDFKGFLVPEEDLADKPFDYAETIFEGYLNLLDKYRRLIKLLKK
jgi:hypothetical protein